MSKPVYELPIGDGEVLLPAQGRRSTQSTPAKQSEPALPQSSPSEFEIALAAATAASLPPIAAPAFPRTPPASPPSERSFDSPPPTYTAPTYAPPAQSAPTVPEPSAFVGTAASAFTAQPVHAPSAAAALQATPAMPAFADRPTQPAPAAATPAFAQAPVAPVHSSSSQPPEPGLGQPGSDPDLVAALNAVVSARASDLHVTAKATPMVRVDGGLRAVPNTEVWDKEKVEAALRSIMSEHQQAIFEENLELDFAYTLSENSRFRVNIYRQRNSMGAAFRLIPTEIKSLASLGVPEKIGKFAQLARGLVLVTGPTGSGKSTTLAALIDIVNSTRADHIVTVEDPIEFLHNNKMAVINQREVGGDTHSFNNALKHVLRQDPDVILIGELRDLETISVALTAAETGHLVFATLHTQDAAQTVDRVIDVFPPHQQGQVRAQLAATLQGVVCQTLVKKVGGGGRAVATEVLITTPAISNLIREGKTYQIHSSLQAGRDLGMHTLDQHLADLVNAGQISHAAAYEKAHDIEDLKQLIQRLGSGEGASINGSTAKNTIDFGDSYSSGGH